ncbi:DinB family protein [Sediminibacter sp. Hel_I_10]|uniref:DinB family protein n=1 Tax=Sediminibacter sp. Hel_I_10 TaxID=1392490 RepID=UPI00047DEFED|nr:DinB family protein [Sediminibacter sp. Hel_I_10]
MTNEQALRHIVIKHLEGGAAFSNISKFLEAIDFEKLGERSYGLPYSFYELFYHIRFAQKDILDYCAADAYTSHDWPDDYWPREQSPENNEAWESLKSSFFTERKKLADFIGDEQNDLLKPVKHSENHTLIRELLLVIEHNSYHIGQLAMLLRLQGLQ